ncbi:2,3-bisphosphoglycerate-independent phosphoglycerate mutase isoform X3 [Helianthus annuus]|uniref:2,3-bisphosphoglycerate-independent phosphoglycerate mutase isoform X3 n=1 Tax=Helianthus annuus TaxID=4232 RepID=UPI000B8EFE73|nr:2,3-bisphosphoglycerate-independent phosphoglycerate mutase isoform X3 [Helianthus annuus]XP_022029647.1 2,3-bisphosphoglycerate-independent phosphoglycerate mutase isoform X3 [Helianthus annuus]XP_022029648.1 2,3-bisphosphoglycerate-independent phosphoglycerate mutase isoform X3 [Helianthus annuus]
MVRCWANFCSRLLLKGACERGAKRIRVHALTDSRGVVDGSSVGFAQTLEKDLAELRGKGIDAQVASGGGRMYVAMDRYEIEKSKLVIKEVR